MRARHRLAEREEAVAAERRATEPLDTGAGTRDPGPLEVRALWKT
jgi:hypothetical protein